MIEALGIATLGIGILLGAGYVVLVLGGGIHRTPRQEEDNRGGRAWGPW